MPWVVGVATYVALGAAGVAYGLVRTIENWGGDFK